MRIILRLLGLMLALLPGAALAQNWVTAWTGAAQGPYPSGYPLAQPVLTFAFPVPQAGARDQSFRLIVRPDIFGPQARLRFSNAFGTRPVTLDTVSVGLQESGAAVLPHTSAPVSFAGARSVTIAPGAMVWSDPAPLPFIGAGLLEGRKLAVSFHVAGESGPMTWHAKALTTSYLSPPGGGAGPAERDDELGFPFSTTSWYFLDAIDMVAPEGTRVVVAFGDSITDGTASTLNGDDRWPDVLARRLHAAYGARVVVVNEGIGGNQVLGPAAYSAQLPSPGGPSAGQRLARDVLSLSGVRMVIWQEGINDFGALGNATPEAVEEAMRAIVARLRAGIASVRVIGATLTPALGSTNRAHGSAAEDARRRALNDFIRTSGLFDGVVDFDAVTRDSATGELRAEFVPDSATGGAGDKVHPNRAGYQAMGAAVPLEMLVPDGAR
jgi:lysophospholipase L1-like esterase